MNMCFSGLVGKSIIEVFKGCKFGSTCARNFQILPFFDESSWREDSKKIAFSTSCLDGYVGLQTD